MVTPNIIIYALTHTHTHTEKPILEYVAVQYNCYTWLIIAQKTLGNNIDYSQFSKSLNIKKTTEY